MNSPAPLAATLKRWKIEAVHGVCDTGNYHCRYHDWGQGPAIFFIHGLTDCARSFVPLMAELKDDYRCIAYELPGTKNDRARLMTYTHVDFVADLRSLLDHLKLESAVLFGSSFGSTITLRALHDLPDRLSRGILQGGFAHRPLLWPERALASFGRYFPCAMHHLPLINIAQEFLDRSAFRHASPETWTFFKQNSGAALSRAVATRALMLDGVDLRPLLPNIRQPVLMIGGEDDKIIPLPLEQFVQERLPNVRRTEFPVCGHYPQYVEPIGVAAVMREFLRDR